ncbi:PR domain zinc finger protein 16 [Folsomia candida]|uniref:PR domain zinc finger protein 16 n=1 Tax=Folsomia candida TaxID=158441 RepID=A0A226DR05_FOLCA|nr:PR domain zinc finger protein 16 [Folsomia candida]
MEDDLFSEILPEFNIHQDELYEECCNIFIEAGSTTPSKELINWDELIEKISATNFLSEFSSRNFDNLPSVPNLTCAAAKIQNLNRANQTKSSNLSGSEIKSRSAFNCNLHNKQNIFERPTCSQKLSTKTHLKRHIYLKHSPCDISVQCPICQRTFSNQVNLDRHRRPASTAQARIRNLCRGGDAQDCRLRCDLCGQRFFLKSGLNRHYKKFHRNEP